MKYQNVTRLIREQNGRIEKIGTLGGRDHANHLTLMIAQNMKEFLVLFGSRDKHNLYLISKELWDQTMDRREELLRSGDNPNQVSNYGDKWKGCPNLRLCPYLPAIRNYVFEQINSNI